MPARFTQKRRGRSHDRPEAIATVLLRASPDGAAREGAPLSPHAWREAVGDRIATRARPIRLDRKILTVRAATSVWAQELTFVAPTIVTRLRALGFEVESLRFCVGPVEASARVRKPPPVKAVLAAAPLPAELARAIQRIEDPELRESLARAAASNLAWQAAATSALPVARAPRSAARENAPPGQTPPTRHAASRHKP